MRHVSIEYPYEYPELVGYGFFTCTTGENHGNHSQANQSLWVSLKAVIKLHGRIVKTKIFRTKTAACTWAKQTEGNLDYLDALGLSGASITVEELAKETFGTEDLPLCDVKLIP